MDKLFATVLDMSLAAGYTVLVVMVARIFLKKAPKIFSYILWSVVLFRLLCPVSLESTFSLVPDKETFTYQYAPSLHDNYLSENIFIDGSTEKENVSDVKVNPAQYKRVNIAGSMEKAGAFVWITGVILIIGYGFISNVRLKHRLKAAVLKEYNIFETDRIISPFVIGFFKPRIYIPSGLDQNETEYIIMHEQIHIKRKDYLIKPLSFVALAVHWFNPLVWISFFLMTKDMEMSCDEKVIKSFGNDIKTDYSNSLLSLSAKRSGIMGLIGFGENSTKSRVKNILNYKKPVLWVIIISVCIVAMIATGLAVNPLAKKVPDLDGIENLLQYKTEKLDYDFKNETIFANLDLPENINYHHYEIFADEDLSKASVYLDTDENTRKYYKATANEYIFQKNALVIFSLIGNINELDFYFLSPEGNQSLMTCTRKWANDYLDGDISKYANSSEKFTELLTKIELKQSAEKFAKNNLPPDNIFADTFIKINTDYISDKTLATPEPLSADAINKEDYDTEADFLNSQEGVKFQATAYKAAKAFLSGNTVDIAGYLFDVYEINELPDVFDDIDYMILKWNLGNIKSDDEIEASYEFLLKGEDSVSYVTMILKKSGSEWKVKAICLEK